MQEHAIDQLKPRGYTALHVSCSASQFQSVQLLIDARCDIDVKDILGIAPLR